jgi:ABC-type uncharacterized transport system ATPase subunit
MNVKSLIKLTGITKRFPGVVANDTVDFDLRSGEIHSVLGENGAGKTTLMKILAGVYQPDNGSIRVHGQTVQIRSPQDSLRMGIGMVYQHFTLVPNLTVLENLILGFEDGLFLNLKKARQQLQQLSEKYGLSIDPDREVRDLGVSERQRTEILKILFHDSEILILDEPTSMLSPAETERLFQTLQLLRNAGKAIALITHNLSEALAVSDRITVMRAGIKAAELSRDALMAMDAKTTADKILNLMFGAIPTSEAKVVVKASDDQPVLQLRQVKTAAGSRRVGLKEVSFSIGKGEIFGVAGVDDEDRRLLAEVIGGQRCISAGQLIYRGQDISHTGIAGRFELGIRYISDDRINEGCVLDMDLAENAVLQSYNQHPFSKWGILNPSKIQSFTADLIKRFGIQSTGPQTRIGALSGGNIQKFILARSLSGTPGLLICSSPSYGLDARTVHFIHESLMQASRKGAAVLLITSDIDELLSCCDRIGALFNGEIIGLMNRGDASTDKIGKLMLGICE